ncbi:MAG: glycosyltransferase [Bacteroidaceae bacterium]|nr:glycosyltransferase [Bacteroidaceae bacterium]
MKITVAISCYNQEVDIRKCLESVMAQNYDDVEILVVDDHSTDNSREVVKEIFASHPEKNTRLVVHDTNKGLSIVRNTGIQEASGDAIIFIDGDDTMVKNTLGLFGRKMNETHADVVCGSFRMVDECGELIRNYEYPSAVIQGKYAFSTYVEQYIKDKQWFPITMWNKLYRLDWLKSNNIYCATHFKFNEDIIFTFNVVLHSNKVAVLDAITYNWTQRPMSISHKKKTPAMIHDLQMAIEGVFNTLADFRSSHSDENIPQGLLYILSFVCLTTGTLRSVLLSDITKTEKKQYIRNIKNKYREYHINRHQVVGVYNKMSYLIMMSPSPYRLFLLYHRNLKPITKMVRYCKR